MRPSPDGAIRTALPSARRFRPARHEWWRCSGRPRPRRPIPEDVAARTGSLSFSRPTNVDAARKRFYQEEP